MTKSIPIMTQSMRANDIPPLAIYLMKLPRMWFPCDIITGGVIINIFLGIFLIYIIWQIALQIFQSKFLAGMAALLAASNPFLVEYSTQMTREIPYLFFASCTVLFFVRFWQKQKWYDIIWAGISCSLSYLCRHEAFELYFILGMICFFLCIGKIISWQKAAVSIPVFLTSGLISLLLCSWLIGCPIEYYYGAYSKMKVAIGWFI
ncbi:glycosyltransferase family 39 protein [Victivallis sp. Marseille-Q1083]|uniref:glycosyltransferase family 39 protein n=1 Tax=Victivallis sp. Marseille-Q1083 TaxID=2717288 RepID=UPI001C3772B2|nr:glycosyltransferase family 39 protein [Victivallis sp. Marseille-Q1083]